METKEEQIKALLDHMVQIMVQNDDGWFMIESAMEAMKEFQHRIPAQAGLSLELH